MSRTYNTGDVVGTYTIIGFPENHEKLTCRCNSCGAIVDVYKSNIYRENKVCKYCRARLYAKPKEDLSGRRFGRLTAIRYVVTDTGRGKWECLCDCGNTVLVATSHLKSGHTKSCGCYMRDRTSEANSKDLTGQRFGRLVVVKKTDGHLTPAGQLLSEYLCKCDCGNTVNVLSLNLVKGNTRSCGCLGNSRGAADVCEILSKSQIPFTKEHTFADLKTERGGYLRFDFALWNKDKSLNCLIEFNGEQHYYEDSHNTEFGKLQREKTDEMKKDYCNENNIILYEIRFDDNIQQRMRDIIEQYQTNNNKF